MSLPRLVLASLAVASPLGLACHAGPTSPTAPTTSHDAAAPAPGDDAIEASGAPADVELGPGRFSIGGATITVVLDEDGMPLPDEVMEAWVRRSATMVSDYLGSFPVPSLEVSLVARGWGDVGFGLHEDGRWIKVYCGSRTQPEDLLEDWVLVHEMLHAAFPDLSRRHRWMQEGLSTYLEPIVRARAGSLDERTVWRRWVASMHYGRPQAGDQGLDNTHTWGRTYWGGALFWLVVDVELRKRTDGRASLRDVVIGLLEEGGNGREDWSTRRVVQVGDRATGTTVLRDTYAAMAEAPGDVDLDALYAELGVREIDGEIVFDDTAPLAKLREQITSP